MSRHLQSRAGWFLLWAITINLPCAHGDDFSFSLPQLVGPYEGALASRSIDLDLGMRFAQIDDVSLQIEGSHLPGRYGDLNFSGTFSYPAELVGYFPEAGPGFTSGFDVVLPKDGGPIDLTLPFEYLRYLPGEVNFDPLLDGKAELSFGAHGPFLIATTYVLSQPQVTIDSATLIVRGQADLDTYMLPGDYDRNGVIDARDYQVWTSALGSEEDLRADGNGDGIVDAADYTIWRDRTTSAVRGEANISGVPEPGGIATTLVSIFFVTAVGRWRQRENGR